MRPVNWRLIWTELPAQKQPLEIFQQQRYAWFKGVNLGGLALS
jgi:hypothetical protein